MWFWRIFRFIFGAKKKVHHKIKHPPVRAYLKTANPSKNLEISIK